MKILNKGIISMLKSIKKMLGMGAGDEILGSISTFSGNYAPMYYMNCDGRLLEIHSNTALYSIISTTYGGDGKTTFALPDLRPFDKDGQSDTGYHRRVDWSELSMPRQIICISGSYPTRP